MSSTQMLLTNLAKKYAKVAAPAATVTTGSLIFESIRMPARDVDELE
jgi:hypothetical protein